MAFLLNQTSSSSSSSRIIKFFIFSLLCFSSSFSPPSCLASCTQGCDSMAFYTMGSSDTLFDITTRFNYDSWSALQTLNNISNVANITVGTLIKIPFSCSCDLGTSILGHNFSYSVQQNDILETIGTSLYGNLTTSSLIQSANPNVDFNNLQISTILLIPINCSCGDPSVSDKYGLFGTYAAQPSDNLSSMTTEFNISQDLIQRYNPSVSFNPLQAYSILFIPSKNSTGQYPPYLISSVGSPAGNKSKPNIILGAAIGGACFILFILGLGIFAYHRNARSRKNGYDQDQESKLIIIKNPESTQNTSRNYSFDSTSSKLGDLTDERSMHFSYDDLAMITDNFNVAREIGRGGFATVYYGERNEQKLAIKKMDKEDTKEFMNELRILSTVHHANLVGLVGYCMKPPSLFLVYEYIENGTLADHLRSKTAPMSWDIRVQIALDAARGVEYMHDYTRPTYIHRDLKPNNILLDKNYHAKVGDFGLTKLMRSDGDGMTNTLGIKGTFGYMPPEFAQFGQVSVKLDVYAFGVILFQIISGKEAILGPNLLLISLFENVLNETDAAEKFKSLVDPALDTDYPFEAVWKVAQLAKRCTDANPDMRPQMRDIVMELIMLLHGTSDTSSHN